MNETVPALSHLSRCVREIIRKGPREPRGTSLQLQSLERCTSTCEIESVKGPFERATTGSDASVRHGVIHYWSLVNILSHLVSCLNHVLLQDYHDLFSQASTAQGKLRRGDSTALRSAEGPPLGCTVIFEPYWCRVGRGTWQHEKVER